MPRRKSESSKKKLRAEELIPLRKAAEISGLTRQQLAFLIRQGKLWGDKMGGRDWYTTKEAVREYMARDRRPGPKTE